MSEESGELLIIFFTYIKYKQSNGSRQNCLDGILDLHAEGSLCNFIFIKLHHFYKAQYNVIE